MGRPRPRVVLPGHSWRRSRARHVCLLLCDEPPDCRPTELTFFERVVEDLEAFVNDQDVFWVAGGSTANLLAVWRLHGLDSLLRTAYERGAVLCGVSAGMNCWFEGSTTGLVRSYDPLTARWPRFSFRLCLSALRRAPGAPAALFAGLSTREGCLPDGQPMTLRRCTFGTGAHPGRRLARDEARACRVEPGTEVPLPTRIL
jgi:dipeptidase E